MPTDLPTQSVTKPSKPAVWNDPTYRAIFFQALVLGGVIATGIWLVSNTLDNLARQGVASGFDFLGTTAGFSIGESLIEYSEDMTYGRAFWVGLLNTIQVSLIGIALATILGFIIGVARLSSNWLIAKLASVYIEVLRNIPLLLQIFFWYFAVLRPLPGPRQSIEIGGFAFANNRGLYTPKAILEDGFGVVALAFVVGVIATVFIARWARRRQDNTGEQFPMLYTALGLIVGLPMLTFFALGAPLIWEIPELQGFNFVGGLNLSPELVALSLALSIYTAAFIAEIVRAGIQAISHGQTEASYSLGMRPGPTLRLVIIPQALRVIIPPLTNQYLNLTKNSSLAAAIAYPDLVLVFAGTSLMQTGQAVEIMGITMGIYLALSLLISAFMNWYNKKMALVER